MTPIATDHEDRQSSALTPQPEHSPPKIVLGTACIGSEKAAQARFYDTASASKLLQTFRSYGYSQIDTARAYPVGASGTSEEILGQVDGLNEWATTDSKVESWRPGAHGRETIAKSVETSLGILKREKLNIEYLHAPDRTTPFEETCEAMDVAYRAGHFSQFGLSNYSVDDVRQIVEVCERRGFVKPTVYQGRYNPLCRLGESELFPVLRENGISFYAYSPTGAGFFSGKVTKDATNERRSRWDNTSLLGARYANDYFSDAFFNAAAKIIAEAEAAGITGHAAALRWTVHNSALSGENGDGVIVGASSVEQLRQNLDAVKAGPLTGKLAMAMQEAWEMGKEASPNYYV